MRKKVGLHVSQENQCEREKERVACKREKERRDKARIYLLFT